VPAQKKTGKSSRQKELPIFFQEDDWGKVRSPGTKKGTGLLERRHVEKFLSK